jgi:hypothetical protein
LQKKIIQKIIFMEKSFWGGKTCSLNIIFKVMLVAPLNAFWLNTCNIIAKNSKVTSSWNNIHKWHIVACSHKIDGCKIQEFY